MADPTNLCPRCGGLIPNDQTPGLYPGALSRLDSATEVCSACALDEGLRGTHQFGLLPLARSEWFDRTGVRPPLVTIRTEAPEGA